MNDKKVQTPDKILKSATEGDGILARDEAEDFSEKKLEQDAKKNEHNRKEDSRTLLHWCNKMLIVILYIFILAGIIVFGYHLLLPESVHFITHQQFEIVKNLLFSALATNFAKEFIKNNG